MENKSKPTNRLDGLKTRLRERIINRRPLTKQIQDERNRKNERSNYASREMRKNWFIYFLLGISALFTGMLGLFMGLAPYLETDPVCEAARLLDPSMLCQQNIYFNSDFGHVVTAIIYIVAFVTITEGAFIVGKWKFHTREENNNAQWWTMIGTMSLAFVSILGTGWAGGAVVASTLGFLSEFREIPASAQDWAVRIIPTLFGLYTVLFTVYWLSSESSKMERIANQERVAQRADHEFTMEMLELDLEEEVLVAEAEALIDLMRSGKIGRAEYQAARRAKMSIPDLEEHLGRDLNGDGLIKDTPAPTPSPAPRGPIHRPNQNKHSNNGKGHVAPRPYDLPGLLRALNMDQARFKSFLMETETLSKAWQVLRDDGLLPLDITHRNFNELAAKVNPTVGAGSK